ncbi:MAG: SDR family oxidoreductase [Deltaproteobacteria bacterium]|nr:SDR family oxidoreductase [Deltaproteobacteria bacterium]
MRALITGASRGIGRATALRLGADGGKVIVNYLRNLEAAEAVCEDIRTAGGEAWPVAADVRSPAALQQLAWEAEHKLGGLDLLVHNAAMGALKPMERLRVSHWDLTLETSLRPFWLLTKLCLPLLGEGSSVIGISSLGSRRHTPGYAAMGAAKGGMEALVRQLAVELAPKIRVNGVVGGLIETDALDYLPQADELRDFTRRATPLGRVGVPEDIAGVVAMLASPDARWITGQLVVADGGLSAV